MCSRKVRESTKKEGDAGSGWGSDKGKRQREVPGQPVQSGEEDRGVQESGSKNKMDLMDHLMCVTTWKIGILQFCYRVWEELGMVT